MERTKSTELLVGTMPGQMTLDGMYSLIAENAPEISGVDITVLSSGQDAVYIAVLCMKKDAERSKRFSGRTVLPDRHSL